MAKSTFQIPEDLSITEGTGTQVNDVDLSQVTDLAAAEQAVVEAATGLADVEDPSDEQLDRLDALVALTERIREEGASREGEAQARRDRAAAARERLAGPASEGGDAEEETPAEEESTEDAPAEEGETSEGDDAPAEEEAPETQAVAASGRKRAPSLIRNRGVTRTQPQPQRTEDSSAGRAVITASAGVRGFEAGSTLDGMDQVVEAFQARAASHPQGHAPGVYNRNPVVAISRGVESFDGLVDTAPEYRDDPLALMDHAADEKRLSSNKGAGSLAAAGGWCAPSETLYDLVSLESNDGMFDQPEVRVNRGGVNLTTGPDFSSIYAGVGFAQTEAQAIAGTTKTCYEVECPDFEETRLDAVGICIKSPLLTNAAYPELTRRVISGAMVAHEHKKSLRALSATLSELGAADTLGDAGSTARNVLTGLELAAEGQRAKFHMARNTTMEVVLPNYVRPMLRDDLQSRLRQADPVTDAQLDAHFAARKLRVQFIYGYSDTQVVTPPSGANLLIVMPATITAAMYPAGTFVRGVADVINLDTVYDSTDLQSNVYTAAFIEEGMLVARRAPGGGRLIIPTNQGGRVGPADLPAWAEAA